ncbi:MAG: sel1 repeat family protein [Desulfovibrio sp.]|nr:sel1 repeat family protein [Desulfovibrio sp.]
MKKLCTAALVCAGLLLPLQSFAAGTTEEQDRILTEAWTAYNIGNYKKTISLVTNMAADGNPRAQVMLGRCYENGLGVEQDLAVAAQWFQLAAEQNDAEAQVLLAYCYEVGAGVPRDPQQVMNLMTRAAQAGNAEAQFNLALNYSQGINGAPKNEQEAFNWAQKSANQGYAQAERFLGACYEYGFGVNGNQQLANEWYAKAEAQGLSRKGSIFNKITEYKMN